MKTFKIIFTCFCLILFGSHALIAQEKEEKEDKGKRPVRDPFGSSLIIDNQTSIVPSKGTLQFDMNHRFGTLDNGFSDFFGIYAPGANIRMGLTYSLIDDLAIGVGLSKLNMYLDLHAKYAIFKQRRDWSIPVGLTYYANMAIDTRDAENFEEGVHRYSYYHELIISSRLSRKISVQVTPSFSHYNAVDSLMSNDVIGIGVSGRFKVSSQTSIIFDYNKQLTSHEKFDVQPNYGLGVELTTSSHAFQIFASTFQGILPQHNMVWNTNELKAEGLLLGFNITRISAY